MGKLVEKFGLDKITHFLAGYVIASFISTIFIMLNHINFIIVILSSIIVASLIGLFKEIGIDTIKSKKDFIATVLGAISSIIPIVIGILIKLIWKI